MTAVILLQQLRTLGMKLTPHPDGTLRYKAPKGTMTPDLLDAMRQHKAELLALLEEWSERAAIAEYCGGLSRADAKRLAWECVLMSHAGCAACGYEDGQTSVQRGADYE